MREELLEILRCPKSGQRLKLQGDSLVSEGGGTRYPIRNGIPRFVPESNYADSFGFQWNIHARSQLDSHSKLPISHNRLWQAIGQKTDLTGQCVLEAGSGAGRFTEILARSGATVVTFDYSSAIDANARNHSPSENIHFFQGDIFNIPLAEASFDKVVSLGVIQHTPDPQAAFKSLAKYVRPGGQLVIDVYKKSLQSLISWKYLLRPVSKRIKKEKLYRFIKVITPHIVPLSKILRKSLGRYGSRLLPIVEYSHLGISKNLNIQWAILDTFDMYSPFYDYPQSLETVTRWFQDIKFENINVRLGMNGIVGSALRPVLD